MLPIAPIQPTPTSLPLFSSSEGEGLANNELFPLIGADGINYKELRGRISKFNPITEDLLNIFKRLFFSKTENLTESELKDKFLSLTRREKDKFINEFKKYFSKQINLDTNATKLSKIISDFKNLFSLLGPFP